MELALEQRVKLLELLVCEIEWSSSFEEVSRFMHRARQHYLEEVRKEHEKASTPVKESRRDCPGCGMDWCDCDG